MATPNPVICSRGAARVASRGTAQTRRASCGIIAKPTLPTIPIINLPSTNSSEPVRTQTPASSRPFSSSRSQSDIRRSKSASKASIRHASHASSYNPTSAFFPQTNFNSVTTINPNAVHVRIFPRPQNLAESRAVLKVLERYGEVVMYKNLQYETTHPAPNAALAIFASPGGAQAVLDASPVRFVFNPALEGDRIVEETDYIHELARKMASSFSSQSDTLSVNGHDSVDEAEATTDHEDHSRPREFHMIVERSRFNHQWYLERQPFYGGFAPDLKSVAAVGLLKSVPLVGLADVSTYRKELPHRIQRRRVAEASRPVGLRALWEDGLRDRSMTAAERTRTSAGPNIEIGSLHPKPMTASRRKANSPNDPAGALVSHERPHLQSDMSRRFKQNDGNDTKIVAARAALSSTSNAEKSSSSLPKHTHTLPSPSASLSVPRPETMSDSTSYLPQQFPSGSPSPNVRLPDVHYPTELESKSAFSAGSWGRSTVSQAQRPPTAG